MSEAKFPVKHFRTLAQKAVEGAEDVLYAIYADFITYYRLTNFTRFTIFPQMTLPWKPDDPSDRRSEIPDIGIGNFTPEKSNLPFKLRFGLEAKRSIPGIMSNLPPPAAIISNGVVKRTFQILFFQAEDQAKAAFKNKYPLNTSVPWVLAVGPYWNVANFGPFTEAQMTVRAHKKSGSADWRETSKIEYAMKSPPPKLKELYLLWNRDAYEKMDSILKSTDGPANPYIKA